MISIQAHSGFLTPSGIDLLAQAHDGFLSQVIIPVTPQPSGWSGGGVRYDFDDGGPSHKFILRDDEEILTIVMAIDAMRRAQ